MDTATVVGLVGAFGVVLGAILLGGSVGIFFNIPSLVIVLGGTLMVVLMKFNMNQFTGAVTVAQNALKNKLQPPQTIIPEIVEMASLARKEGVLALEEVETKNAFLKAGLDMLIDGSSVEEIDKLLSKDLTETAERHKLGAQVFTAAGDVAPAMGMIGTLVGLVQMLSAMDDPKSIGPAMAVALLTTLYGAILANMLFQPIADKLTLRRKEEIKLNSICLDGVLGIQDGQHPRVLESLLKLYITPKEREAKVEQNAESSEEDMQAETVAA
ncbi:MAG: flagellar motor protein PomA [Pseudomonadales bacterium]|nr:flagellar motor protein PomA [Pseudomonadales bacterium]